MKRIISICVSILMLISIASSVPFSANSAQEAAFQIKIVHTNDIHARVAENAKSGIIGVEKLKGVVDDYTADADMDLILDSGDTFHGQSIATLVQGESIARLLKECGYDAMTAGNHDWSYGKDRLRELSDMAGIKMLVGNVVDESNNMFFRDEYYTEEVVKGGQTLKVGIFGVIDPAIYKATTPSNVDGLTFTDSAAYANKAAAELKREGCDVVIALSHTKAPTELAAKVNGVDLWLCGHEHIGIDTAVTTPDGSVSYVIEDGCYLYQAGLIELRCTLDENGWVSELKCSKTACNYEKASAYKNDAAVSAVLNQINSEQSSILNQVVGSSPAPLDGVWENLRIDETNLGRAVTGAYLLATGADVAFENAGGIRASIEQGEVTYGDIIGVSPYGNYIVTKKVTGKQLKEILETSIDIQIQCIAANADGDYNAWPQSSGSYLQSGGMVVKYNPALEKGSRVISVVVGDNALDENRLYTVATNNYVAVSSYYPQLANAEETGEFCACDEALIEFFRQSEALIFAAVFTPGMIKTDKTSAEEQTPVETLPDTEQPSKIDSQDSTEKSPSPQTADAPDASMYFTMLALSAMAFGILLKINKNKENQ